MIKKLALLIAVSLCSISSITVFAEDNHSVRCVRALAAGEQEAGQVNGEKYMLEDSAEVCVKKGGKVVE